MHGLYFVAILTISFWQAQFVMPLSEHSFLGWYFTPSGKTEGGGRPSTWFHLYRCPDKSSTGAKGQSLLLSWCVWNISCCLSDSLLHPAQDLQCCKHSWSNISCQQQSLFPPEQAFVKVLPWTPPQSLGQPQICWERPIGNKPEAWATTQPESPGWKPEIPGEIHALDFFFCWSLWMAITNHKLPRDNVAALQQSLPMTFCSLESQHWNCYCLTTLQDLPWAFPAGDLAPWVAGALDFLCNPIILCVLSVSTSRQFEAGLFLDTLAQMGRKISIHGAGENPAMGWYNPHASAELVSTNMLF